MVYHYLHLIANMSDEDVNRVWGEIRATSAIAFRFREKATAYDMAPYLSEGNIIQYDGPLSMECMREYVFCLQLVPSSLVLS